MPKNKKSILLWIVITWSLTGCMNLASLEKTELPRKNPTQHTFNVSLSKLQQTILASYNKHKNLSSPFYKSSIFHSVTRYHYEDHEMLVLFSAETADSAVFGKHYFIKPGAANDIYLHPTGESWHDPVYHARGKPLEFRTAFILQLKKIDEGHTLLTVKDESPKVMKGAAGIHNSNLRPKEFAVEPTTIEEYSIILFIAEQLGETGLEPLRVN